jgi:hypothetical protein
MSGTDVVVVMSCCSSQFCSELGVIEAARAVHWPSLFVGRRGRWRWRDFSLPAEISPHCTCTETGVGRCAGGFRVSSHPSHGLVRARPELEWLLSMAPARIPCQLPCSHWSSVEEQWGRRKEVMGWFGVVDGWLPGGRLLLQRRNRTRQASASSTVYCRGTWFFFSREDKAGACCRCCLLDAGLCEYSSREKEGRWATLGASTKGEKEDAPAMACPFFTDSEKIDSRHTAPGNVPPYV